MGTRVLKYKLDLHRIGEVQTIPMTGINKNLKVGFQSGDISLWVESKESKEVEERHYLLVHTGYNFDSTKAEYVGTVLIYEGAYIIHVYEVKE